MFLEGSLKFYGRVSGVHNTCIKLADQQGHICGDHKKNKVQQKAEFCPDWASGIAKGHESTAKAKLQLLALTANFKNQKVYFICSSDFIFFLPRLTLPFGTVWIRLWWKACFLKNLNSQRTMSHLSHPRASVTGHEVTESLSTETAQLVEVKNATAVENPSSESEELFLFLS